MPAPAHQSQPFQPRGPWVMAQTWEKLLFGHWPIPVAQLKPLIPPELSLDTYEGEAWVSIVPFALGYMARGLHTVLPYLGLLELNLRTYVHYQGKPAVYFFCLDATDWLSVTGARLFFKLPYNKAKASLTDTNSTIRFQSQRTDPGILAAGLDVEYGPVGPIYQATPGSLEAFLTNRFTFFTVDKHHTVYEGNLIHPPWPLQAAEAKFRINTLAQAHQIELPDTQPLLQYADHVPVKAWPIHRA